MERGLREKLPGGKFENVSASHSRRMGAIKGKGTKTTEKRFRALLVQARIRGWSLNPSGLTGSPDVLFQKSKIVIFLDGCYWHGCPRCGHIPNVNRPFWSAKITRNRERDQRNTQQLEEEGHRVLRFWEHELAESPQTCIEAVRTAIRQAEGT